MWELDYEESWAPKNWCFWIVTLKKTLESPLDFKEIQPVHPKGNQCWIFIGRTDADAETPILWPPDGKNWLIGKDWRQEKEMTEDEMVGWHHQLDGREFEQALGVGDGQGSLVCCSPWGHRVRHNWATKLNSLVGTLLWLYHHPPHAILLPYQCYSPLYTASLPLWCPPLSTSHNTGQNPPSNFSFLLPPLAQPIFLSPTL